MNVDKEQHTCKEILIIDNKNSVGTKSYIKRRELQLLLKYEANDITSNIHGVDKHRSLSSERFHRVQAVIPYSLSVVRGRVDVLEEKYVYSDAFIDMLTVLIKSGNVLILSELDEHMIDEEIELFISALKNVQDTFEKIVISTQNEEVLKRLADENTKFIQVSSTPVINTLTYEEAFNAIG